MSVRDLLPWRQVLPLVRPDVLAESLDRAEMAEVAAAQLHRTWLVGTSPQDGDGIDKTVFGPYRKASVDDADYGLGR